jgi:hypothetical protein
MNLTPEQVLGLGLMIGAVIGAVFGALAWLITQRRPLWATMVLLPRDCLLVAHVDSKVYEPHHAAMLQRMLEKRLGSGRVIVVRGLVPITFTAIKETQGTQRKGVTTMRAAVDEYGPSVTIDRG